MQNRSIERMVLLGFSMSLGLILVVSGIAWYSSYNSREASKWVTHTHEVIAGLENVASALHKAESAQRGYFVTGQASPYLAERRTAISEMERQLERVATLTSDSLDQQKQINALREALDARVLTLERGLQMYGSPTTVGDMAFQDIFILGTRQMGEVMSVLLRMREQEEGLLGQREEEAYAQHRRENIAFGALVPLVMGLLGFLFYRIRDDMAKRTIAEREQKKLTAILDATPDLVAMADAGMRLSYINRAGRRILGLGENSDISQLKISDLSCRDDGYAEDRYSVAQKQGSWRGETRLSASGGGEIPALQVIMAHAMPDGGVSYSTIAHDISERHRSEGLLREAANYEESHNHALALFSSTFDRKDILEGVLELLAQRAPYPMSAIYLHDDWRGCYVLEAGRGVPLEIKTEFRNDEGLLGTVAASMASVRLPEFEDSGMRLQTGVGEAQPAEVLIVPIVYQGRSMGVFSLAAIRPLNERDLAFIERLAKQLGAALHNVKLYADTRLLAEQLRVGSEEIARKNVELEQASKAKSEFLANMSHELRTPLNSIIGFADVLKAGLGGELSGKQLDYLSHISGSGQHLLALINDILDLSKVEAGKMELDLSEVDISAVLESSLGILREKAALRRIELGLELAPDLGALRVDERRVKQILFNLLSNAIKFSDDATRITVAARRVPIAEVGKLDTRQPHRALPLPPGDYREFVELQVRDQGIGISQAGVDRLFQPFTQVDSGLSRRFEGTGLGLVMVMRLAELHGGSVGVSSQEGEGTTFSVWLPLREGPASGQAPVAVMPGTQRQASSPALTTGESNWALVVEDDDQAAELICLQLEGEGFQVERVSTAEAGLALARQKKFALVTLDILLPGMDGWEFLAKIKESPETANLPVVIISIVADSNRGLSLGASAILQKPISHQMLADALDSLGLQHEANEKLNVLVIDDDPRSVDIIADYLQLSGCSAIRTYGGKDGVAAALRTKPDLIVLDLMMPDMSGFEVVEVLKSDRRTARIPVLVVTAKQIVEADRHALNGNVMQIIEKSEFNHGRFVSEVRRVMGAA
ncbi:MAG TPA: response regulator [Rhodocyclaceae bacterium]|nr:response regulator [Rhodocyclaceae bacterium]